MIRIEEYRSDVENQWCPGCPNFGILAAIKRALAALDLPPHRVCLVSGIGQAAKLPHYLKCNLFNGLHGRAVPVATAIRLAHPGLTTIVTSGDGCVYGEGGNHLLHAFRRNPDITVVVHDNRIYALTKGQGAPTTRRGVKTRLQFDGVSSDHAQMLATAVAHDCPFVARGFAGDLDGLTEILREAIAHRGLSLVDVIQPCITWGPHSVDWYRERIAPLPADYDPADRTAAIESALENGTPLPTGVLYRREDRPTFEETARARFGDRPLAELPPIDRSLIDQRIAAMRSGGSD